MSNTEPHSVSPHTAFEEQRDSQNVILDVRTEIEFAEKHLTNCEHIPLDRLSDSMANLDKSKHHFLLCLSGKRASKAAELLRANGFDQLSVVEGGIDAWDRCGLPVERSQRRILPLMRQVQLVVGILTLTGSLLAIFKDPLFAVLPAFLGAGLTLAGSTSWCGLALLLAKMPWNRGLITCQSSGNADALKS